MIGFLVLRATNLLVQTDKGLTQIPLWPIFPLHTGVAENTLEDDERLRYRGERPSKDVLYP